MAREFEIHPRLGVARLGNSEEFYLAPETVGGLPHEWDPAGPGDPPKTVEKFKDGLGRVKRQAARFRIFERVDGEARERALGADEIDSIEWTVHIANKKPIWYTFSELQGDLEFGEANSYENQHVPRNNSDVEDEEERRALIIDPGPRSISEPGKTVEISRYDIPPSYTHGSFPPPGSGGQQIDLLGELRMDDRGALVALGGLGNVTGSAQIDSFRGASGYWDDIADGFVLATVVLTDGTRISADPAWLMVGSPKYAPELVNITTLHDTMYDVAIREMGLDPRIYPGEATQPPPGPDVKYWPLNGYDIRQYVDYETQIRPIFDRIQEYRWVADIPYLADYAHPGFDLSDPSPDLLEKRRRYFESFRVPLRREDYAAWAGKVENGPDQLFSKEGIPLMPLNSGDNSVTNQGPIYKFETLTPTQYFFLHQWAEGKFHRGNGGEIAPAERVAALGRAGSDLGRFAETAREQGGAAEGAERLAELAHHVREVGRAADERVRSGETAEAPELAERLAEVAHHVDDVRQEVRSARLSGSSERLTVLADAVDALRRWAEGALDDGSGREIGLAEQLDMADTGNCVGAPFSPGIETTWIVRNAPIYSKPFQIKLAHWDGDPEGIESYYRDHGLSTTADEARGQGCEPGDLTKRMAIPWQADFSECTVQMPNISNRTINQQADGTGIEVPPAYYVYWWPPQSPMHVVAGSLDPGDQVLDGIVSNIDGNPIVPAGQRVPYQRGILSAADVIQNWSQLGFIVNQNPGTDYPYFVETERGFRVFGQLTALQQAQRIAAVQNK